MKPSPTRRLVAATALLPLALAACSSKATGGDAQTDSDGVAYGSGVTDDSITFGAIVPLSGPIGGLGQDGVVGAQLYFDKVNAAGGVCGRDLKIDARDNKYDSQQTVTQYTAMRKDVVAIANLAPGTDAVTLKDRLEQDEMAVVAGSYDPALFAVPQAIMPGAPYDVEAVNGLSHLLDEGVIAKGDTVGVIAYPSGIGTAVTTGVEDAAKSFGLEVETTEIDATSTDATSQVNTLKRAGAKVIVMGTSGAQTVSAASVAEASGYDVTIQATNLITSGDLAGPAGPAILEHVVLTSNSAPFSSDEPAVQDLVAAWKKKEGDRPLTSPVNAGYVMAEILGKAAEQACEAKDLTPAGILDGMVAVGDFATDGLSVNLDYSELGKAPSLESFILKPDAKADGGAVIVSGPGASDAAKEYAAAKGYVE